MSQRTRLELLVGALLCAASFGAGEFAKPARVTDHTVVVGRVETKYADRVVEKTVERADQHVDKEKVVTVTRTVTVTGAPIVTTEIRYVDREHLVTQLVHDRAETVQATTRATSSSTTDHVTVNEQPRWLVAAGAGGALALKPFGVAPQYLLAAQYRIAGPFGLGAWGSFQQTTLQGAAGVMVSIQF